MTIQLLPAKKNHARQDKVRQPQSSNTQDENQTNSLSELPQWKLAEITLSPKTLDEIKEMIAYAKHKDKLLKKWKFNRFLKTGNALGINFFGPPGTGKSITAEAIAQKLGMRIVKVNYGEVESELVGGTSKNLAKIFQEAESSNSLLFFDEADTVLGKRITNVSQAADHGVNSAKGTLLTLMDNFHGVIVFATNLFENYDPAFLRRLLFHVEFPTPDLAMRTQLWKFHICEEFLNENFPETITYERLAEISEGLCGGDIKNITIKLGLKRLVDETKEIDEVVIKEQINNYKAIKLRHQKINLNGAVVEENENNSDLQEE